MDRDEIRHLYKELAGYLKEAPELRRSGQGLTDSFYWDTYHSAINRLNSASGKNYDHFKIQVQSGEGGSFVRLGEYRQKLSGLINRLKSEYFRDENDDALKSPGIVISQTQQQNQQVFIQMVLDVQSKIDEKLPGLAERSAEKTFFQKLKGSLSATTGIIDLLAKMLKLAEDCGISTDQLSKLFS